MRGLGIVGVGFLTLLAGCGADQEPLVIALSTAPPECYVSHDETKRQSKDPRWIPLPDKDVTRSEGARNHDANRSRYGELERLRAICDAGLRGA
jgi:hypothetical protein